MKINWKKADNATKREALKHFSPSDIKNIQLILKHFNGQVVEITDEKINNGLTADEYIKWCDKSRKDKLDEKYIKEKPYKKNWKTK